MYSPNKLQRFIMASMALLSHLRTTIKAESHQEMTTMNVKTEAENFSAQRVVRPATLLVFVTDPVFAHETMRSQLGTPKRVFSSSSHKVGATSPCLAT